MWLFEKFYFIVLTEGSYVLDIFILIFSSWPAEDSPPPSSSTSSNAQFNTQGWKSAKQNIVMAHIIFIFLSACYLNAFWTSFMTSLACWELG